MRLNQIPLIILRHFSPRKNRTVLRCDECGQVFQMATAILRRSDGHTDFSILTGHLATHTQLPLYPNREETRTTIYAIIRGDDGGVQVAYGLPKGMVVGQVYQWKLNSGAYIVAVEAANPKHARVRGEYLIRQATKKPGKDV
jgi:hypothetical protein